MPYSIFPALPHVAGLHAYTPGLQPAGPGWTKLNTNECPYPPSPRVAEALRHEIGGDGAPLRLYPDPKSSRLRAAVARHHGLGEENVLVGNGSDDVLNLLVRVFGGPSAPVGFTVPSYSLYPVLAAMADAPARVIELDRTMQLPVAAITRCQAPVFFLTSPNAPTGIGFANDAIEAVLADYPGVLVVDEAYAPFARENAVALLALHPRLVVTRTLSKAHALAGLRVGYALADPGLIGLLDRVRDSYNVGRLAQAAALAALGDPAYYAAVVARIAGTRDAFAAACSARGWFTYPSEANFVFTEPRDAVGAAGATVARALYEFLLTRRILVRHFPGHALTAPFLRVSIGTDAEMDLVNQAFTAWPTPAPPP
jgi:histidinol-phosphate aminotransferase